MSVTAAAAQLVAALEATGLRVAIRDGDITPPVCYIHLGTGSDAGAPLAGTGLSLSYVYYIPIRGIDNLFGDAEAIDTIVAALAPIAWAEITWTWTSTTVKNETWPCYRFDVSLAGLDAALLKG